MSSAGQGGVHGRRASQSLMPSAMPPPPLPSTLLSTQSSKHVPSARASPAPSLASTSASRRQREYSFVVEVPMRRSRPTGNAKRAIASTSDTSRASVTPAQAVRPVDPSVARYPASTHPGSAVRARRSISSSLQISADASLHTRSPATATSSGHSRRVSGSRSAEVHLAIQTDTLLPLAIRTTQPFHLDLSWALTALRIDYLLMTSNL